jgi:hypothetical protein
VTHRSPRSSICLSPVLLHFSEPSGIACSASNLPQRQCAPQQHWASNFLLMCPRLVCCWSSRSPLHRRSMCKRSGTSSSGTGFSLFADVLLCHQHRAWQARGAASRAVYQPRNVCALAPCRRLILFSFSSLLQHAESIQPRTYR